MWPVIYSVLALLAFLGGLNALSPAETAGTNADWIFVALTFVTLAIGSLGAVAYGFFYSKKQTMRRPSWDRHPLGWWTDTLQSLRVSLVGAALHASGAVFALPAVDEKSRMMFYFYVAIPAGLFVGERLVYWIYRARIAPQKNAA